MTGSSRSGFRRFDVRVRDAATAERVLAEAHEAGAAGLEERTESDGGVTWVVYAAADRAGAVRNAVEAELARAGEGEVGVPETVPDEPWVERWRDGIALVRVSPRLAVRPSFVPDDSAPGEAALVVEPGQAFGTGSHESTWLALALLEALPAAVLERASVLDVGTGSGVLSLAAVHLGARRAVGFDLDPLAAPAARANARANPGLSGLVWFTGPIAALSDGCRFDIVLANLLRSELEPLVPDLAARVRPGGYAILAGLLAEDLPKLARPLQAAGLVEDARLERVDADGAPWVGLRLRPGG